MPRPAFTWFPYRALALAVPVIGMLAWTVTVWNQSDDGRQSAIKSAFQVLFLILGAGNGYTLGLATGDLRRTIVGTVGGALLALLTTPLLGLTFAGLLFSITMLAFLFIALESKKAPLSLGLCGAVFMLAVSYWSSLVSLDSYSRDAIPMAFGSTFICSGIGIFVAQPWTMENVIRTWITSSAAAVLGIVCTLPLWVVAAAAGQPASVTAAVIFMGIFIIIANYFYMRLVFNSIERREPVASGPSTVSDTADGTTR